MRELLEFPYSINEKRGYHPEIMSQRKKDSKSQSSEHKNEELQLIL